jgi:hypothetical protein
VSTQYPAALNSKKYKVSEHNGERHYDHRWKAGLKKKSKAGHKTKTVVDHGDNNGKNNGRGNLKVIGRGANVGKSNKRRKGTKYKKD